MLQFAGTRKENLLRALEDGRATASVMARLEAIEQEENELKEQIAKADSEIDAATVIRPTAEQVTASWESVLEVWPELEEDEKTNLLSLLVEKVVVTAKDRVVLHLSAIAGLHGQLLAINSQMGAGARLELATFGL